MSRRASMAARRGCLSPGLWSQYRHGFSLVELLVVMLIIAVILGIAIPRFDRATTGTKLKTTTDSIVGLLETAKSYAQAQHTSCGLVLAGGGRKIILQKKDIDDADNDGDHEEFIEFDRGITIPAGIGVYLTADGVITFSSTGGIEGSEDDITVTAASINRQKTITVNAITGYIQVN
jgi:prepilin-type N-terminal cleavage/methylation domain-containing protein